MDDQPTTTKNMQKTDEDTELLLYAGSMRFRNTSTGYHNMNATELNV